MAHFSIAHVLRLRDGMYAVRSADYPQCEGRDVQVWPAREKFRTALSEQVTGMIEQGELPPALYPTLDEAQSKLGVHCRMQLESEDRQPNTSDYAVIVDLDLPSIEAERLTALRVGKLLPESRL
jgi:hypothetical protein